MADFLKEKEGRNFRKGVLLIRHTFSLIDMFIFLLSHANFKNMAI